MSSTKVEKVVVVGGGTAGWTAAAAIAKLIGANLNVVLVESDAIGTVGVGEATIPPFRTMHRLLKIDEAEFLSRVPGTFKLAIQFAIRRPDIATTVVSSARPESVRQWMQWVEEPLDEELVREVETILAPVLNEGWPSGRPENS